MAQLQVASNRTSATNQTFCPGKPPIKQFLYAVRTVAHAFREDKLAKPKQRCPSFRHVDVHNLVADDWQADHRQLVNRCANLDVSVVHEHQFLGGHTRPIDNPRVPIALRLVVEHQTVKHCNSCARRDPHKTLDRVDVRTLGSPRYILPTI